MAAPIEVQFQLGGVSEVQRAFETLERMVVRFEAASVRAANREARERTRAAQQGARDQQRAFDETAKAATRELNRSIKEFERGERDKTRLVERESKARQRAEEQSFAAVSRAMTRELNQQVRDYQHAVDQQNKARKKFASAVGGAASTAVSSTARQAWDAGKAGVGFALDIGGGFSLASSMRSDLALRGKAREISLNSGGAVSDSQVISTARMAGAKYGIDTEESTGALDKFIAKSGDAKMALSIFEQLAQLASATGASLDELGESAGIAFSSDKTMKAEQLMQVMRNLAAQGRDASVDMRDLAKYMPRISAAAQEYGGDRMEIMEQLGASAQLAASKGGASSAAEALMAPARFTSDLHKHKKQLNALGIDAYDKNHQLRPFQDLQREIVMKTGGDENAIQHILGERGYRAVAGYKNIYKDAKARLIGQGMSAGDADKQALAEADKAFLATKTKLSRDQVSKESDSRVAAADKQVAIAMQELHAVVARELVPEFIRLMPELKKLIPVFADLAKDGVALGKWLKENPFTGLGAVIAAKMAGEIGSAMIGEAVKNALLRVINGGGGSNPGSAPGGAPGSSVAGPLLALGTGLALVEQEGINSALAGQKGGQYNSGVLRANARNLSDEAGQISPQYANAISPELRAKHIASLRGKQESVNSKLQEAEGRTGVGGIVSLLAQTMALPRDMVYHALGGNKNEGMLGGESAEKTITKYFEAKEIMKDAPQLNKAVTDSTAALKALEEASTSFATSIDALAKASKNIAARNGSP